MTIRKPLVLVAGVPSQLPNGDTLPNEASINMLAFSSAGTYTKNPAAKLIVVDIFGASGGGGASTNPGGTGGTTSFGAYLSVTGGGSLTTLGVITASLPLFARVNGTVGVTGTSAPGGQGGLGVNPGGQAPASTSGRSGAGGSYARIVCTPSALSASVAVTVGAGGVSNGDGATAGLPGFVLIQEVL